MPCRTEETYEERAERRRKTVDVPIAFLCGLLTVLENEDVVDLWLREIDWKEAGITKKEALEWWKEHKAEDELRRKREAKERKENELRISAMSKLTPEERQALGLDVKY
jgi:hypothetical protein